MYVHKTIPVAAAIALIVLFLLSGCGDEKSTPASSTAASSSLAAAGGSGGGPTTSTSSDTTSNESAGGSGGADAKPSVSGEVPPTPTASGSAKPPSKKKKKKKPAPEPTATSSASEPSPPATAVTPPPPQPQKELAKPAKGSADEVAQKLDDIFVPVKTFHASFKQKYTAKVHGTSKKSKGLLWVQKPGKLSLKYKDPNKNRAVSDGTTLKVYEHDNQQMFVKKVKNTEYPGAFAFILGNGLRQSFKFKFHKTSKWEGGAVLIGTPRVANPGYKKVLFYIDDELLKKGDHGCVRRVLVLDAQGNRNRFDFVKASTPDKIDPKIFEFTPPAGTEILKP